NDEADRLRASLSQPLAQRIRLVAQPLGGFEDPRPRGRTHVVVSGQRTGHRRNRKVEVASQLTESHAERLPFRLPRLAPPARSLAGPRCQARSVAEPHGRAEAAAELCARPWSQTNSA